MSALVAATALNPARIVIRPRPNKYEVSLYFRDDDESYHVTASAPGVHSALRAATSKASERRYRKKDS